MHLTPPGEIFQADFRSSNSPATVNSTIKLLQWNIERGYKLQGIIEELKRINADVISLQEIDIGCERSKNADTGTLASPRPKIFLKILLKFFLHYSLF